MDPKVRLVVAAVATVCALMLTGTAIALGLYAARALRYEPMPDGRVLDTWRGEVCYVWRTGRWGSELQCPSDYAPPKPEADPLSEVEAEVQRRILEPEPPK